MNQTRNENKILRKVSRTFSTAEIKQEHSLLNKMYVLKKGKKNTCVLKLFDVLSHLGL